MSACVKVFLHLVSRLKFIHKNRIHSNPFFLHMFSLFVFLNFTSWSLKVYKSTQKKKRSNLRNGLLAPILILWAFVTCSRYSLETSRTWETDFLPLFWSCELSSPLQETPWYPREPEKRTSCSYTDLVSFRHLFKRLLDIHNIKCKSNIILTHSLHLRARH